MRHRDRLSALIVGCFSFVLYLFTAGPSIVPYRDAGEMASSVPTLGILHPTSYPLYSIVGFLFTHLPLANPAYRLNICSALAMAGVWGLLWLLIVRAYGRLAAWGIIVIGALSYHFWWHALVSEMYALNAFFLAALLLTYYRRQVLLWGLLLGLGLANRADLLLTLPAFTLGFMLDSSFQPQRNRRTFFVLLGLISAGLLLYLYLPLRALQQPWLNWNDPSTWDRFLRSVLRRGYGSGLDLLSDSYTTGENFLSELKLYTFHLWRDYAYVSVILALAGLFNGWRMHRARFLFLLTGWIVTGPLFIFLGNLPPNPHAVAILEAAYLMPDLFFFLLVAEGISFLALQRSRAQKIGMALLLSGLSMWTAHDVFFEVNQRHNYLAVDYSHNTYASLPAPAMIVGRSDVPLFALYYGHWIYPKPAGRMPIAQGLVGSTWYQDMVHRDEAGLSISSLKTAEEWAALLQQNPGWSVWASEDIDWPAEGTQHFLPQGLVNRFTPTIGADLTMNKTMSRVLLQDLYVYRDCYVYGHYRDFFSNELVEAYAKAWMQVGDFEGFKQAWATKPSMPYASLQLGYSYLVRKNYRAAQPYYVSTLKGFDAMEKEMEEWKTLPAARQSVQRDHAVALQHWKFLQDHLMSSRSH